MPDGINDVMDETYTKVNVMHNALLYMRSADDSFVSSAECMYSVIQHMRPATDYMCSATERMAPVSERINSAIETMQLVTEASRLHAGTIRSLMELLHSVAEKHASAFHAAKSINDNNNSNTLHMHNEALQMRSAAQINASSNDFIHSDHETIVSRRMLL